MLRRTLLFSFALFVAIISSTACNSQPEPAPSGWRMINTAIAPPPNEGAAVAYNSGNNTAVLFGGTTNEKWVDETWIWNGSTWVQPNLTHHPAARAKHAMAYDEARNRVVLFGGASHQTQFDDTWEWSGDKWQLIETPHKPPGRCCHAMTYDRIRGRVMLHGGWDSVKNTFFDDTWEWDGSDWEEVTCCSVPKASGHTLNGYTPQNEILAILSGDDGTWTWDGQVWRDLNIFSPPSRSDGKMAYDDKHKWSILFGGNKKGEFMGDTWVFIDGAWTELNFPTHPPRRFGHIMFYDTRRQSVMLFGGADQENKRLNDTWELNLPDDLTSLSVTPTPDASQ
jgi:hypothetical protein